MHGTVPNAAGPVFPADAAPRLGMSAAPRKRVPAAGLGTSYPGGTRGGGQTAPLWGRVRTPDPEATGSLAGLSLDEKNLMDSHGQTASRGGAAAHPRLPDARAVARSSGLLSTSSMPRG